MSDDRALLQSLGFIEQRLMHINEALVVAFGAGEITLRDRFAMAALTGILAGDHPDAPWPDPQKTADRSYAYADAMLSARESK